MVSTGRALREERRLLWLLAALQFTHIFDLMMISPLGPQFMRLWQLSAGQFGVLVAVYAVAAALAGVAASFVIDRFDRRSVLLLAYAGFTLSTLACALAPGYASFLVARGLAGIFGGVIGSIVMALVGDLIPVERRGRAMGLVMSAFPLVAVAGIPFGLWLGTHWGWQMPFFVLAATAVGLWCAILAIVPPVTAHMVAKVEMGVAAGGARLWHDFAALFRRKVHRQALLVMFIFTMSGYSVFPYLSAYYVANVGITEAELAYVFFFGGLATLVTSRMIGRLADARGKRPVFVVLAVASCVPILVTTHLSAAPLWVLLMASTLFMVLVSGRFIPFMALTTMWVHAPMRGRFMSLSSAVQNLASGVATVIAGAVIGQGPGGELTRFDIVGDYAAALTVLAIFLVLRIQPTSTPLDPPTVHDAKTVGGSAS